LVPQVTDPPEAPNRAAPAVGAAPLTVRHRPPAR